VTTRRSARRSSARGARRARSAGRAKVQPLGKQFVDALEFAARLHASQTRKGSRIPYVAHLLAVTSLALENGASEEEAITALLHDAVEDQGGERTRRAIARRFGTRVASLVVALSDSHADTLRGARKEPWRTRKERYLAQLAAAEPSARLVACCDKLHNLRSLIHDYRQSGEAVWRRFSAGRREQLWFFRRLVKTLTDPPATPRLGKELQRALAELERVARAHRSQGA
jgi:(p)ppGpp synthase/HD superfamily hydrolase